MKEQEVERVKYIELVANEAKIRENNKKFYNRKQMKMQESLLQPLENKNASSEPLNPLTEKYSDLIVKLFNE